MTKLIIDPTSLNLLISNNIGKTIESLNNALQSSKALNSYSGKDFNFSNYPSTINNYIKTCENLKDWNRKVMNTFDEKEMILKKAALNMLDVKIEDK